MPCPGGILDRLRYSRSTVDCGDLSPLLPRRLADGITYSACTLLRNFVVNFVANIVDLGSGTQTDPRLGQNTTKFASKFRPTKCQPTTPPKTAIEAPAEGGSPAQRGTVQAPALPLPRFRPPFYRLRRPGLPHRKCLKRGGRTWQNSQSCATERLSGVSALCQIGNRQHCLNCASFGSARRLGITVFCCCRGRVRYKRAL